MDFIRLNPGTHFRGIARELDIREGALRHTLRALMLKKRIRQVRYRNLLLLFPADTPLDRNRYVGDLTDEVFERIRRYGVVSHRELQEELRVPRTTLNYHIAKLLDLGTIEILARSEGRHYKTASSSRSDDPEIPRTDTESEGSPA